MKRTKKSLVIATIRGTAPKTGTTIPGDILINATPDQLNWFPRREFVGMLIGAGLTGNEPYLAFVGAKLNYEQITIEQADIDAALTAGAEGVILDLNGRDVTFKKPGVKNTNLSIDWSTFDLASLTDAVHLGSAVFDLKEKVAARTLNRGTQRPAAAVTPSSTETIEEPANDNPTEAEMPEILKGVKDDGAGNHVNADDSPLNEAQVIAMKEWVAAKSLVTNP